MQHKKLVVLLVLLAAAAAVLVGVALIPKGSNASTALRTSASPSSAPPAWLLNNMARQARICGDPHASAWWTLTTADKAVVVEGGDTDSLSNSDRPVYIYIIHGNFTQGTWSGAKTRYKWAVMVLDANSRIAALFGSSPKPFDTSGLVVQTADLTATPSPQPTT
jgi:hypothetical protein